MTLISFSSLFTFVHVFLFIPLTVVSFYKKKERKSSTFRDQGLRLTYIIGSIEEESWLNSLFYSRSLEEEGEREKSVIVSPSFFFF